MVSFSSTLKDPSIVIKCTGPLTTLSLFTAQSKIMIQLFSLSNLDRCTRKPWVSWNRIYDVHVSVNREPTIFSHEFHQELKRGILPKMASSGLTVQYFWNYVNMAFFVFCFFQTKTVISKSLEEPPISIIPLLLDRSPFSLCLANSNTREI